MKLGTITFISIVGIGMSVAPSLAGPVGVARPLSKSQQAATIAKLETAQQQEQRAALMTPAKGPLLVRYMDKQSRLQDLIDRIQSGRPVSPAEIDNALQPTVQ